MTPEQVGVLGYHQASEMATNVGRRECAVGA